MKRVVFGGSFDPVHAGHLAIADAVQAQLAPDRLSWVPSRHAPHKPDRPPASAEDRVAFLRLAIAGRPREEIDLREMGRPGPSYTVDTLESMHVEDREVDLHFVAGADSLTHLATWRALPRLFELCCWWFAPRPGYGETELREFRSGLPPELKPTFRAAMLAMDEVSVSSSAIREALQRGEHPEGLPSEVAAEIRTRGCYSN